MAQARQDFVQTEAPETLLAKKFSVLKKELLGPLKQPLSKPPSSDFELGVILNKLGLGLDISEENPTPISWEKIKEKYQSTSFYLKEKNIKRVNQANAFSPVDLLAFRIFLEQWQLSLVSFYFSQLLLEDYEKQGKKEKKENMQSDFHLVQSPPPIQTAAEAKQQFYRLTEYVALACEAAEGMSAANTLVPPSNVTEAAFSIFFSVIFATVNAFMRYTTDVRPQREKPSDFFILPLDDLFQKKIRLTLLINQFLLVRHHAFTPKEFEYHAQFVTQLNKDLSAQCADFSELIEPFHRKALRYAGSGIGALISATFRFTTIGTITGVICITLGVISLNITPAGWAVMAIGIVIGITAGIFTFRQMRRNFKEVLNKDIEIREKTLKAIEGYKKNFDFEKEASEKLEAQAITKINIQLTMLEKMLDTWGEEPTRPMFILIEKELNQLLQEIKVLRVPEKKEDQRINGLSDKAQKLQCQLTNNPKSTYSQLHQTFPLSLSEEEKTNTPERRKTPPLLESAEKTPPDNGLFDVPLTPSASTSRPSSPSLTTVLDAS